ncbi:cation:proton antiporter [Spirulina major]|uniref:cation:proton antiporter n=1 Tax=Spirulina major TaxID=270636 RepID=UPI000933BA62|nr:cation:proton antiporter [Spirulina major]
MLGSLIWILGVGFLLGQGARSLKLPPLVGMIGAGILLGPQGWDRLAPTVLATADQWRSLAVMVILMKAGLGLDQDKLQQQGTVALRLGILPATGEAIAVAIAAMVLLQFDFPTALLLGCILGAESPAVIVPGMLRLKQLGWGVAKGIPDAILTGSALSDVLLLLVFSLLLNLLTHTTSAGLTLGSLTLTPLQLLPFQLLTQISGGLLLGYLAAHGVRLILVRWRWTQNPVQDLLVAALGAMGLVLGAEALPLFSGYMAVMTLGFCLVELDAPLARRLRQGFDGLWGVAEIILFVLLGAAIAFETLTSMLGPGLLILAVGTLIGRAIGWGLATWGSNWTGRERLFLLPGNSAKATVQAAIGAIPLAAGVPGGDRILALAALSILITAPLGAWAIPTFAPKLLQQGRVDPTKTSRDRPITLLAAVDTSPHADAVLTKAADLARRCDGHVVVLHVVTSTDTPPQIEALEARTAQHLADIRHDFKTLTGDIAATILTTADHYRVDEMIFGKRNHPHGAIGSVAQTLLATSPHPMILVDPALT